uniref:G_PROTEIN_RECEP_F1_2 domain-containing protein n=1 Tax=Angiostrongylus cantonensis TaxID=6313 RepID=A0A158PBM0_ANGCA
MNYQLIVCFQLAYITPSILLYFIEFCYIFASKHAEYKSAFYYIFLIRAPADMMQVIVRLIAHHFPIIGWLTVINIPYIAKIGLIIEAEYLVLLELIAHLILSINRFTGIYYPVKYNHVCSLKMITYETTCYCSLKLITGNYIEEKTGKKRSICCFFFYLQGLILLHVLPSKIHEEVLFVVVLTFTRDALALSNPWLLLILTKSFRSRFLNAVHCRASPSARRTLTLGVLIELISTHKV